MNDLKTPILYVSPSHFYNPNNNHSFASQTRHRYFIIVMCYLHFTRRRTTLREDARSFCQLRNCKFYCSRSSVQIRQGEDRRCSLICVCAICVNAQRFLYALLFHLRNVLFSEYSNMECHGVHDHIERAKKVPSLGLLQSPHLEFPFPPAFLLPLES